MGIYGASGIVVPFIGIKIIDLIINPLVGRWGCNTAPGFQAVYEEERNMKQFLKTLKGAVVLTVLMAVLSSVIYPAVTTVLAQTVFKGKGRWKLDLRRRKGGRL